MQKLNILITGGGIAGLAAAAMLTRSSEHSVEIVEKRKSWPKQGYAIAILEKGLIALTNLGLTNEVIQTSRYLKTYQAQNEDGKILLDITSPPNSEYGYALIINRNDLQQALLQSLSGSNVNVRIGTSIKDLDHSKYDLVIGADGVHSESRDVFGFNYKKHSLNTNVWAFKLKNIEIADKDMLEIRSKDGSFIGIYSSIDNTHYCLVSTPRTSATEVLEIFKDHPNLAAVREKIANFDKSTPNDVYSGSLWEVFVKEMYKQKVTSKSRCFLIGDAAHALHPATGMGASLALEDAMLLSKVLSDDFASFNELENKLIKLSQKRLVEVRQAQKAAIAFNEKLYSLL